MGFVRVGWGGWEWLGVETSLCAPARWGIGVERRGWDSERVEDNQRYSARAENWKTREAGLEGRRQPRRRRGQARFSAFLSCTGSIDHRHPVRRNTRRFWPPEAAELWQSNCGAFLRGFSADRIPSSGRDALMARCVSAILSMLIIRR